jgi:uncharacterized protein (TIGR03085 family)
MAWVDLERRSLAATFAATDPEQPTLCEGWTVRHLLAHLVQRERQPLARVADQLSRRGPGREERLGELVERARSAEGYDKLLSRFAQGPSPWSPMAWADEAVNFLEYVIHHEDVRRGGTQPLEPRRLPDEEQQAIWRRVGGLSRLAYRRSPVGVTLALPTGPRKRVRQGEAGVVLTGEPVELLLLASGRPAAAHVQLTGRDESITHFRAWTSTHRRPS